MKEIKKAIKTAERIHGRSCLVCGMNVKAMYGSDIKSVIQFHHARPSGEEQKEEVKDVVKDLVPLCPNFHSVVHSTKKLMTIKNLQDKVNQNRR